MEREIDVSARHLLHWLRTAPCGLRVRATREYIWEGEPASAESLDREDELEIATTVGLLEVRPGKGAGEGNGWIVRLRVENPLACHLPDEGSVPDDGEEIDLDEFEDCFLSDDAPDASVTVEADRHPDARAFDKVLAAILASRAPA